MKYAVPITQIADDNWRTDADLTVQSRGFTLFVPAGFETDLASTPRIVWDLIAPFELGTAGPVVHDWLYRHGGSIAIIVGGIKVAHWFTKNEADVFLHDIMQQDGVNYERATAAYFAVREFGVSSWQPAKPITITTP